MFKFRDYLLNTSGSFGVQFALLSAVLLIGLGVAVDTARMISAKQTLQNAVDDAALHGVLIKDEQNINLTTETKKIFEQNLLNKGPMIIGNYDARVNKHIVDVTANVNIEPMFIQVLGYPRLEASVRAQATVSSPASSPCITALSETRQPSYLGNAGAGINAPDCEVHVHASGNPSATFNSGTNHIAARTCIAGVDIIDNHGGIDNLELNCSPASDSYVGAFPVPGFTACDFTDSTYSGVVTLTPGTYCGNHSFENADVTFLSGLYVIRDGGWTVNGGDWEGDELTFYFADQSIIQFNSAVRAELTAPNHGPYADVIFTEAPSLTERDLVFNDNLGFDIEGIVYLPTKHIFYNAGAHLDARRFEIVASTFIVNQATLNLVPKNSVGAVTVKAAEPRLVQ